MYYCSVTGKLSQPGEKLNKIVVATRPKIYKKWVKDEETLRWQEVEAGTGYETVKEISATEEGVALYNSWTPEERQMFLKHLV